MLWRRRKYRVVSLERIWLWIFWFIFLLLLSWRTRVLSSFGDHAIISDQNFLSKLSVISVCLLHRGGICAGCRRCSRGRGISKSSSWVPEDFHDHCPGYVPIAFLVLSIFILVLLSFQFHFGNLKESGRVDLIARLTCGRHFIIFFLPPDAGW